MVIVSSIRMVGEEAQHGAFSEPTHGIHTTTQRGTVPSCIDMVHRKKRIAWLSQVGRGETQQELIPFKHKEWSVVELVYIVAWC